MLSFILFATVASITPGPTNLLVLSHSARHGWRAALPIILGGCLGAAGIVLATGTGLGQTLLGLPLLQNAMAALGLGWLTWLAWKLFSAPPQALNAEATARLGFWGALALQVVNPKTWMMALATVSVFAAHHPSPALRVAQLALVFFVVSLPCLGCWAALGAGSARWLGSARAVQRMNQLLAILLLISSWAAVLRT
ncbi:LysE family transporter [Pseudomonas sp. NPDC007930]|uniref:LysE family translocator n=1 Tax=Pseudomonas sp. NPDC007930 TaxID=3364417 RepID=UPI0036E9CE4A